MDRKRWAAPSSVVTGYTRIVTRCANLSLRAPILIQQFESFASEVLPMLQKRGLFRKEDDSRMLRGHCGLGELAGAASGRRRWLSDAKPTYRGAAMATQAS
ncbi:hypothetical protein [Delftia sp. JD2]|uniref:hypothetical protein n=1 Tax=Delftia sp. JD2 TaxID=469553 RepID=UPI0011120BC0|nr:hypothetical protein [Delftia sp. JD2]